MKKRILVADDSVTIQKVIALTFAEEPFEIKSVGTGSEAVERMRDWRPDLVLADVIMPQMNGYELCRSIKSQPANANIPVILLAGTFEAFDEEEAKACGADGSITKPFESGELIEKVKTQMARAEGKPVAVAPAFAPAGATADRPAVRPAVRPAPVAPPPSFVPPPAPPAFTPPPKAPPVFAPPPKAPPAFVPPPAGGGPRSGEPDIWDILGDMSDGTSTPKSPAPRSGESATPAITPLQGRDVVDFGSMEMVGIGKPPSVPYVEPPAVKAVEKTKIESRERDFFGLEVEEGGELPAFEADIEPGEEVAFEMAEPASHEAGRKYVAPLSGPAAGGGLSLDVAPLSARGGEAAIEEFSPFIHHETLAEPVADLDNPPVPEPVGVVVGRPAPVEPPAFVPPVSGTTSDRPVVVAPPPPPPVVAAPRPVAAPAATPIQASPGLPFTADDPRMEALVRKIIEEKVEKIVWEVVPEMAEVLIREAIEKLKRDG